MKHVKLSEMIDSYVLSDINTLTNKWDKMFLQFICLRGGTYCAVALLNLH